MKIRAGGDPEVIGMLTDLGFDPDKVAEFSIRFKPDEMVSIDVKQYTDAGDLTLIRRFLFGRETSVNDA